MSCRWPVASGAKTTEYRRHRPPFTDRVFYPGRWVRIAYSYNIKLHPTLIAPSPTCSGVLLPRKSNGPATDSPQREQVADILGFCKPRRFLYDGVSMDDD